MRSPLLLLAALATTACADKVPPPVSPAPPRAGTFDGDPCGGDVVNAYNDGPTEPGKAPLGGFYEVETSSPAAALAPGQSMKHVHATLHVVGDPATLDPIARAVLGVSLADAAR